MSNKKLGTQFKYKKDSIHQCCMKQYIQPSKNISKETANIFIINILNILSYIIGGLKQILHLYHIKIFFHHIYYV